MFFRMEEIVKNVSLHPGCTAAELNKPLILLPMLISRRLLTPFRGWHSHHLSVSSYVLTLHRHRKNHGCGWAASGATVWMLVKQENRPVCRQASSGARRQPRGQAAAPRWSSHQAVWLGRHSLAHINESCRDFNVLWWPDRWCPKSLTVFNIFKDTGRKLQN